MKINNITCISDIYYELGDWFTFIMVIIAFSVLPLSLNLYDSIFSFLMCVGIAFVGVAAHYKDKFIYPIHIISALISALCSVIWVSNINPLCLFAILFGLIGIIDNKRWLLYCEIGYFLSVILVFIIH